MKITDLVIDPKGSLGNRLWLTEISEVREYKDNKRTENIVGHRYIVVLPDRNFEKIAVKIDGKRLLEMPETGYIDVNFTGLNMTIYWINGQPEVSARATGVTPTNTKT